MKILFYGNGGSGNHGCEAIIRGTVEVLGKDTNRYLVHSNCVEEDRLYGLDKLATIKAAKSAKKRDIRFLAAYAKMKLTGNYTDMDGLAYLSSINASWGQVSVALSVGGDNYCYGGTGIYTYLNSAYQKRGIKTVLWGCSIEPGVVVQPTVFRDIQRYDLIVARESITYKAVKQVTQRVILAPDPAFFMKPVPCEIDQRLDSCNVIGLNISPMIISREVKKGIVYENYKLLIRYLLERTNLTIALIPHVVWSHNDDRKVLEQLYGDFGHNERLVLIGDHTAPELKYIISKCKMFIGARTHATIAAYSQCIPTLVVGYSVKACGIARDLFGTEDRYVLPVQCLTDEKQLIKGFQWMNDNYYAISKRLRDYMLEYLSKIQYAVNKLEELEDS